MKIIFISALVSKEKMNNIIRNSNNKPLQSIQRFLRLLCEGIVKNKTDVKTISAIPMSRKILKKVCWFEKKEYANGVEYTYIPFINLKLIRQICLFFGTCVAVLNECIRKKEDKVFVCDILNTTISTVTLIMSKIFNIKCVALVTDLPRDIGGKYSISKKINEFFQNKYDAYIFLTEEMNKIINKKNKKYIVIEGIADIGLNGKDVRDINKGNKKIFMYAGGLYEKYGVKDLIQAFIKLKNKDVELHLYGSGDLEQFINSVEDKRIKFFGVVENDKIIEAEEKATLLINPRFTNEEYTKYSFPSKNMEYMSSGTPVLTTKLPGMPMEYYDYIYTIDEENQDGIYMKLKEILALTSEELYNKGKRAKEFVLGNKNNICQARKIINLLKNIESKDNNNMQLTVNIICTLIFVLGLLLANNSVIFAATLLLWFSNIIFSIINIKTDMLFGLFNVTFFALLLGKNTIYFLQGEMWYVDFIESIKTETTSILFVSLLTLYIGKVIYKNIFIYNDKIKINTKKKMIGYFDKNRNNIQLITMTLFYITLIFEIIVCAEKAIFVQTNSYVELYSSFISRLPTMFIKLAEMNFGFLAMFLATLPSKKNMIWVFVSYMIFLFATLLTGQRGTLVVNLLFIALYLLYRQKYCNEIYYNKLSLIILTIVSIVFLALLSLYNLTRNDVEINNDFSITKYFKQFFIDQGNSGDTLAHAVKHKAELRQLKQNYTFGHFINFFRYSSIAKLLNIDEEISTDKNYVALYGNNLGASISKIVLGSRYENGEGIGTQYLAELYIDYSFLGIIIYNILLGMFLMWCVNLNNKNWLLFSIALLLTPSILYLPRQFAADGWIYILSITKYLQFFLVIVLAELMEKLNIKRRVKNESSLDS